MRKQEDKVEDIATIGLLYHYLKRMRKRQHRWWVHEILQQSKKFVSNTFYQEASEDLGLILLLAVFSTTIVLEVMKSAQFSAILEEGVYKKAERVSDNISCQFPYLDPFKCTCNNCINMNTSDENVCCQDYTAIQEKIQEFTETRGLLEDIACVTEHEGFLHNCLSIYVLERDLARMRLDKSEEEEELIHDPDAMRYYEKFPTVSCTGLPTITYYDGEAVRINASLKKQHFGDAPVQCWYRKVTYVQTGGYSTGRWQGPFSDSLTVEERHPYVEVQCKNTENNTVSKMHHYINRSEKRKSERPVKHGFKAEQMNVLMVGMDSVSSHLFKRSMPKTRDYLLNVMGAIEMNVYDRVGANSYINLLALTTGKYETDMPQWSKAQGMDGLPFIWKDFKMAGYATQYNADCFDLTDFSKPPTDYFNLPIEDALMANKVRFNNNCFEDQIEVNMWFSLIKEYAWDALFKTGRFFSFFFFGRPTHDFPNQASAVDEHHANFLKDIYTSTLLNNTFFIFFADHGPRVGGYRYTYGGSIEERAANMVIYVPMWFRQKHKKLYGNIKTNSFRLTSNFDIHRTLHCIAKLDFEGKNIETTAEGGVERGLSLFSEIPRDRSCADAGITPHNCMCHGGIPVKNAVLERKIGVQVIKDINAITEKHRNKCVSLELGEVVTLTLLAGSINGNAVYRIILTSEPGGGVFEATVDYYVTLFVFTSIQPQGRISRVSVYRGLSDCVAEDEVLRTVCYCTNLL